MICNRRIVPHYGEVDTTNARVVWYLFVQTATRPDLRFFLIACLIAIQCAARRHRTYPAVQSTVPAGPAASKMVDIVFTGTRHVPGK